MDLVLAALSKKSLAWLAATFLFALLVTAGAAPVVLRSILQKPALHEPSLEELKAELLKTDFPDAPLEVANLSPPDFQDYKLTFDQQAVLGPVFDLSSTLTLSLDLTPPDDYENSEINSWWNDENQTSVSSFNGDSFSTFRPPLILSRQDLPPTYERPQEVPEPGITILFLSSIALVFWLTKRRSCRHAPVCISSSFVKSRKT